MDFSDNVLYNCIGSSAVISVPCKMLLTGEAVMCVIGVRLYGKSPLSVQFFCKPKTALKHKVLSKAKQKEE